MATKLRKFSRSRLSKFIAFSLTVVLITASMVMMNLIYDSEVNPEVLFVENYVQSETFVYGKLSRAVRDVINHFVNDTESIKPEPEYLYYITDGEKAKYNAGLDDILEHEKYLYLYENEQWSYGENTYKNVQSYVHDEFTLYLVFTEEYMGQMQMQWEQEKAWLLPIAVSIVIAVVFSLLCIIYLIAVTGRKAEDDEVHLSPYTDRIYSDIQLGVFILVLLMWYFGIEGFLRRFRYSERTDILSMYQYFVLIMTGILTAITTIVCGIILLSLVRKLKAGRLLKHSLIYSVFSGISNFIRSFFDDSRFTHFPLTKSQQSRLFLRLPVVRWYFSHFYLCLHQETSLCGYSCF